MIGCLSFSPPLSFSLSYSLSLPPLTLHVYYISLFCHALSLFLPFRSLSPSPFPLIFILSHSLPYFPSSALYPLLSVFFTLSLSSLYPIFLFLHSLSFSSSLSIFPFISLPLSLSVSISLSLLRSVFGFN